MLLSNPDYGLGLWGNLNIKKVQHVQCRKARVFTNYFHYEISSHSRNGSMMKNILT